MSRIKIFSMLFLTLVLGTVASFFVYQQWLQTYETSVLGARVSHDQKISQSAVQLVGLQKIRSVSGDVSSSPKLAAAMAISDAKDRQDKTFAALSSLKSKETLSKAAWIAAVDTKGHAFSSAHQSSWKQNWSEHSAIKKALAGTAAYGFVVQDKKPHMLIAVPVMSGSTKGSTKPTQDADDTKTDSKDDEPAPVRRKAPAPRRKATTGAKKCSAGTYHYCYWKCLKRKSSKGKKKGKCAKWKKVCYCRKGKKKTGSLPLLQKHTRLAQMAPDDRATGSDDSSTQKTDQKPSTVGLLVVGFALNSTFAKQVQKSIGMHVAFVASKLYGTTLQQAEKDALWKVISKSKALQEGKSVRFTGQAGGVFLAVAASVGTASKVQVLSIRSVSSAYATFRQFNIMIFAIIGAAFLLALILLVSGVSGVQSSLEKIEETLLESNATGDLNAIFNEKSPWVVGSLATTLNQFYRQLREHTAQVPAEQNIRPVQLENSVNQALPPTLEAPMLDDSEDSSEGQPQGELSTNEMITHFLQNPDTHYEEVFTKYFDAKVQVGEDVSRLKKAKFVEKLRKNAKDYVEKYDCRGVLFDVTVKDNKVILKPQLIPKD